MLNEVTVFLSLAFLFTFVSFVFFQVFRTLSRVQRFVIDKFA